MLIVQICVSDVYRTGWAHERMDVSVKDIAPYVSERTEKKKSLWMRKCVSYEK